jgi:hypothetical protein
MSNPVPLTPTQHSQTRVRPGVDASRFEAQQVLPVVMHEIIQAGSECPIIFIKNPDKDQFQPVALLGLAKGENLMIKNQQWQGSYVPGILTNEPFRLMAVAPDSDEMAIGIDESSPLVGGVEGELLFDDKGEVTPYLERRRDAMNHYFEHGQLTHVFAAKLGELELLVAKELTVDVGGVKTSMGGIYLVDEEKLRKLSDESLLELQKRGFLGAIYAHLMSQNQVRNLGRIKVVQEQAAKA